MNNESTNLNLKKSPLLIACCEYVKNQKVDYAIMITGDWGSGKTYFWKNELIPELKKLKTKHYYVSLYGVKTVKELEALFLKAQYPVLENGLIQAAGAITETGLKTFNIEPNLEGLKAQLKGSIVCFDDLERSDLTALPALLGYINRLVEHDEVHVIILCDEKVILNQQNKVEDDVICSEYSVYKEKLVGYTYKFSPEFKDIANTFVTSVRYELGLHAYLLKKIKLIENLLVKSSLKNLRTLNRVQFYFIHIYNSYCNSNKNTDIDENLLDILLTLTFAVTVEIKNNLSNKDAIESVFISNNEIGWYFAKDSQSSYLNKFSAKYFDGNIGLAGIFYSIFKYIDTGVLELEQFNSEYESYIARTTKSVSPEEKFRSQYWTLTDQEMHDVTQNLINSLKNGEIKSLSTLLNSLHQLFTVVDENLINYSGEDIAKIFNNTLNRLKRNKNLEADANIGRMVRLSTTPKHPEFIKIKEKIIELNKLALEQKLQANISDAFYSLPRNFESNLYKLKVDEKESAYTTKPILHFLNSKKAAETICSLRPEEIMEMRNYFASRYEGISNISEYLHAEKRFLSGLKNNIQKLKKVNDFGTMKIFNINVLLETLKRAINILNNLSAD